MASSTGVPNFYWRRIWQISSGIVKNITIIEVHDTLYTCQEQLIEGVLQFKSSPDAQSICELQQIYKWNDDLARFISRTGRYLKLDPPKTWQLLKNYLVHDYCGSTKALQRLKYEMEILPMLNSIWRMYTSERMFKIKTLKAILEFRENNEHPYCEVFCRLAGSVGLRNIWKALVQQFEYLIREIDINTADKNCPLKAWVERNIREQVEIVHCLIMLVDDIGASITDFKQILVLFKSHSFGREPCYYQATKMASLESFRKIRIVEIGLLLCLANRIWTDLPEWQSATEEIEKELHSLVYHEEHGALMYLWVILHMVLPNAEDLFTSKLHKLTTKALELEVFNFFSDMVTNDIFMENCLAGANVRNAMYNLLFITCTKFNKDGQLSKNPGANKLASELLKSAHLVHRFFAEDESGTMSIMTDAEEIFPYNFTDLSRIVESIASSHKLFIPKILDELAVLPMYTELYDPSKFSINHTPKRENCDVVRLVSPYKPQQISGMTIPSGVECVIRKHKEETLIHFRTNFNYWFALSNQMYNAVKCHVPSRNAITNIVAGLKVVLALLKSDPLTYKIESVQEIVAFMFSLMGKCAGYENPSFDFFEVCIDICTELLPDFRDIILSQLERINMLPAVFKTNFTYAEMYKINFLEPGLLGKLILRTEHNDQQHLLIISYIAFLRTEYKLNKNQPERVELPGVVIILKEIFPRFMHWCCKNNNILYEILYHCINFLFELFQVADKRLEDNIYKVMQNVTFQSFLDQQCARCLLRILAIGNTGVQHMMENQINWKFGTGIKHISVIQKVMTIVMQLLQRSKEVIGDIKWTQLEEIIYIDNDNARTVRHVASFLNHPFNEGIRVLACRLLQKFTTELRMSMLASLDMDPDQVRMMFIPRLRDRLECEPLKVAIIELITASIPRQSGMTEAFFKLPAIVGRKQIDSSNGTTLSSNYNEGIGSFLVEYLIRTTDNIAYLQSPLLSGILELLHMLWMNEKEVLITNIIKDEQFWPALCYPLFKPSSFCDKAYSQIFNIMSKELHKKSGNIDQSLMEVFEKFLSYSEPYLVKWLKHINLTVLDEADIAVKSGEDPPSACLLVAWKDFIIIAMKFLPEKCFPREVQIKLATTARKSLKEQTINLKHLSTITFNTELYLVMIKNWGDNCYKKNEVVYADIVDIIHKIEVAYHDLPQRLREAIVAVALVSFQTLRTSTSFSGALSKRFVMSIGNIFNFEYSTMKKNPDQQAPTHWSYTSKKRKAFIMCFSLLNELMIEQNYGVCEDADNWFAQTEIIGRLIGCVENFIRKKTMTPLTKLALEGLIHYAESNISHHILQADISLTLWERVLPPKECRNPPCLGTVRTVPWELKEWWAIYQRVLVLLTILLKKHACVFLKDVLMFVSLHEEYFIEILLLERRTVDMTALDLITTLLTFLYELFKFSFQWKLEHESCLLSILGAVKTSLNCSAAVVMRPNALKYFTLTSAGEAKVLAPEDVPQEELVEVLDKLTDIINLATSCLLEFSPPLYTMLKEEINYNSWVPLVGASFQVPKFGEEDCQDVTFGSIICVSSLYIRIMQQIMYRRRTQVSQSTPQTSQSGTNLMSSTTREILVPRKSRPSSAKSDTSVLATKSSTTETLPIIDTDSPCDSNVSRTDQSENGQCFNQIMQMAAKKSSVTVVGFVRLDYLNPMVNVMTVENFAIYSPPAMVYPCFTKLNEEKAFRALESLITLLASQASLMLLHSNLTEWEDRYLRRELGSELQVFFDFVKRRLLDVYRYSSTDRSNLLRKKYGWVGDGESTDVDTLKFLNVKNISDVDHEETSERTILKPRSKRSIEGRNQPAGRREEVEAQTSDCTNEPKLVPEDYLQLLSNWFMYVLRTHDK